MDGLTGRLGRWRQSAVLWQLVRFGIAGGLSSLIYFAIYLPIAYLLPKRLAVVAVPPAFAVAVVAGFFLHSSWSFRGHGTRERGTRQPKRFLVVQSFGLVLNALFTWTMTGLLHLPRWSPVFPILTLTPLATFYLNRRWVFL